MLLHGLRNLFGLLSSLSLKRALVLPTLTSFFILIVIWLLLLSQEL